MLSKRTPTTLKVSRRVLVHIETNSKGGESVGRTLQRLLGLSKGRPAAPPAANGLMKTIKVPRDVMDRILGRARKKESRDETLRRLLKIKGENP